MIRYHKSIRNNILTRFREFITAKALNILIKNNMNNNYYKKLYLDFFFIIID